jgi:hypothetical protein
LAIDNTGPAAALGRVYVGDVNLEVNGLLALYSEPSEVDEMLRFATGDVRLKLCAAADLRACLHAEDSVDSHGDALAHEDESVVASIMASLYQMHDGDERDDAENQAESAPESDTTSADSSWLSATAEAPRARVTKAHRRVKRARGATFSLKRQSLNNRERSSLLPLTMKATTLTTATTPPTASTRVTLSRLQRCTALQTLR